MSEEASTAPLRPQALLSNPKRVPAEFSVSLRRSQSPIRSDEEKGDDRNSAIYSVDLSAASNVAAPSEVLQDTIQKQRPPRPRSAPSAGAEAWFDESNKNTLGKGNVRFTDHDSPFYLPRNRSSQETDTNKKSSPDAQNSGDSGPSHLYQTESWSDDYRSIIDDLTVENKQLKQTLKKYEQMYSSHMQDNKLFEVYIHALAPQKKRQLEAMLRQFAAGVGPYDSVGYGHISVQNNPKQPAPLNQKATASSQSVSRPVDSAYASMSASGAGASSMSQSHKDPLGRPPQSMRSANQRVRSYVQDLPASLMPKDSFIISEEAKKVLVVQKLEQLFVGRGDALHIQSQQQQQQQEVSNSAAYADKRANEAKGQRSSKEGHREAKISKSKRKWQPTLLASTSTSESTGSSTASTTSSSVEQRPTRPLDLDPAHTQDPRETLRYIKHLGFDSPRVESDHSPERTKGWVFLNLLMNMAQLHTLNVTPDFVRNALSELSVKFELSEDGHSVRWKGGSEPTRLPIDSNIRQEDNSGVSLATFQQTPYQGHAANSKSAESHQSTGLSTQPRAQPLKSKAMIGGGSGWNTEKMDSRHYNPMFYHGDDSDSYNDMSNPLTLDESGQKSRTLSSASNVQSSERASRGPVAQPPKENGTMIFYTAAKFCTDLSGDPFCMPSSISYNKFCEQPMGTLPSPSVDYDSKGPLLSATSFPETGMDTEMSDVPEIQGFEDFATSQTDTGEKDLIELEVSGLHGLSPMDNFLIDVKTNHTKGGVAHFTARKTELNPSPLPEPTYGTYFTSSSSDDGDSETESESGEDMDEFASANILRSGIDVAVYQPPTFRNVYSSTSTRRTMSPSEEDSSIDMLEYARQADPDVIAQGEREFEDTSPVNKMREATPPRSVAATVGDISNILTSQEDGASVDGRIRQLGDGPKGFGLKRSISQVDAAAAVGSPSKRQDVAI